MASDGAFNMVGVKGGLVAMLRQQYNPELVNIHCLAHRLELGFRGYLKKNKLYDKIVTLMIGLHYFYTKSYNNKKSLQSSIKACNIKGLMPPKVTGARWLAHLSRGIISVTRTFKAYEASLCTLSNKNPKAEGMAKILLNKHVICFMLFLKVLVYIILT